MIDFQSYVSDQDPDIRVVSLQGNLDSDSAAYFFSCLEALVEEGHQQMVIDCSGVEHISSMGLGMLMRIHSRMKKVGGIVKLACLNSNVAAVFSVVGFDIILQIYPNVGDAIATF